MSDPPVTGKAIVAVNPWRLAAEAQRQGIDASFIEADDVAEDKAYVIDFDELFAMLRTSLGDTKETER